MLVKNKWQKSLTFGVDLGFETMYVTGRIWAKKLVSDLNVLYTQVYTTESGHKPAGIFVDHLRIEKCQKLLFHFLDFRASEMYR